MKKIGLIKNEDEYKNALDELEKLMHANIAGKRLTWKDNPFLVLS